METSSRGRQALALAADGRAAEALALLDAGAEQEDGEALFMRGLWRVEGRWAPRDLVEARRDLARAAELSHRDAARTLAGFAACGAGGKPDWNEALALLDRWSPRDPVAARQRELIAAMALTDEGDPRSVPKGELLSDSPHVMLFAGLLSAEECGFLAELAGRRFKPALIFHEGQGRFVRDPIRDSDAAGFPLVFEWPFVHALNRRLAAVSGSDVRQGETLQVLRYRPGQQYHPHFDAVPGLKNQRQLTAIVWLNDDYEGGETRFLETDLSVRGRRGDTLLFRNVLPDGRPDPASRHAGCPILSGEKLIASRWIRARPPAGPDEGFGRHEAQG